MIAFIDEQYMPGEGQIAGRSFHVPVLLRETVSALQPAAGKTFLDGTVGGGGHALALLEAGASVIAGDQDPEALAEASRRLAGFSGQVQFVESNFADSGLLSLPGSLPGPPNANRNLPARSNTSTRWLPASGK